MFLSWSQAGASMWAMLGFLVPFSLGPLVGIIIGVNVSDSNNWVILVRTTLAMTAVCALCGCVVV